MQLELSTIASALQAQLIGEDMAISSVSIDTRTLQPGDLYIGISGENFDGCDFVDQAAQAGAVAVLVERQVETDLAQLIVKDSRIALAELAKLWRQLWQQLQQHTQQHKLQQNQAKLIAVTGSNGKTTVKEMLAAILSLNSSVLATKGNFNNDIGVPLTLLRLKPSHHYAAIEMGANHAGEIAYSSRYTLADVAIINNVGAAHLEGFGSLEGVACAKGEIISGLSMQGIAVLNKDDAFYPLWQGLAGERKTISFGFSTAADVYASNINSQIKNHQFITSFDCFTPKGNISIGLKLAGQHNVKNALAAATACLAVGLDLGQIKQGLETLQPVTGRLEPWIGRLGNIIIDDSYNANPNSLKVALQVLEQCSSEAWLILGAFNELGENSVAIHKEMGTLIKNHQVKRLFAVGENARYSVETFGQGAEFFLTQDELIARLKSLLSGSEALLIKGSRGQRMENVAASLIDNFRM